MQRLLIFLFIGCHLPSPSLQWSSSAETNLRQELSTNYSILVRPQELTVINIYFQMNSLDYINMRNQDFKVSGWWFMSWNDSRLTWTPSDYDDIEYLYFYQDFFWKPSMVVANSIEDLSAIEEETIPARVRYDGLVIWQPPGIETMSCAVKNTYFPFDKQTCFLMVISSGFTSNEIDLSSDGGIRTDFFVESGDWSLHNLSSERNVYDVEGLSYVGMTFTLTVKRRSSTHWINIIIPILLNGALIPMVFLLPPDSGEKMGYSLTVLLAYFVLLTMLMDDMSTSAKHISLLEVYITITLGVATIATALTIMVLRCYSTDSEKDPVPKWLLKTTRFGMILTCGARQHRKKRGRESLAIYAHDVSAIVAGIENKTSPCRLSNHHVRDTSIEQTSDTDQSGDELTVTWQVVANVMDAVFFRISSIFLLLLTFCFILLMNLEHF